MSGRQGSHPIAGLYVPGDRPDRFDKAADSGAELIILDLEDAVALANKALARRSVAAWLAARGHVTGPIVQVRINAGSEADLQMVAGLTAECEIRVPKVQDLDEVAAIADRLPGRKITAIIESARGIEQAYAIASHPAVSALALGEADLAADLGTEHPTVIDQVRATILIAAKAAGLPAPMMSVYSKINDLDGLRTDTEHGRSLGWVGRVAVHPRQLPVIRDVFRSSDAELGWARQVLAALQADGVARLPNGDMVDEAMARRARAILGLSS